ncbi:hypothetical protein BGZ63DRAFT_404754 [Mariannaea sp. PMI_226]|nr:hypothetical protein BGZ63DRAFT_404754 [Mariannaea sp. PMI_226]
MHAQSSSKQANPDGIRTTTVGHLGLAAPPLGDLHLPPQYTYLRQALTYEREAIHYLKAATSYSYCTLHINPSREVVEVELAPMPAVTSSSSTFPSPPHTLFHTLFLHIRHLQLALPFLAVPARFSSHPGDLRNHYLVKPIERNNRSPTCSTLRRIGFGQGQTALQLDPQTLDFVLLV